MSTEVAQTPLFAEEPVTRHLEQSHDELVAALLGLGTIKGLGRKGVRALFEHNQGQLGLVFAKGDSGALVENVLKGARVPSAAKIAETIHSCSEDLFEHGQKESRQLAERGISIFISYSQADLPARLKSVSEPPYWLFVEGDPAALFAEPAVAVVGTRNPTDKGRKAAQTVAKLMGAYPLTLVSGLAEGIDEEVHRAALEEGITNVAFLGHGINHVFPEKTSQIRKDIVQKGGAVASEYFPDETYQKSYFVERNRLQAALAHLVIPVEAKEKSGTAHTLRFAEECKRTIIGLHWRNGQTNGLAESIRQKGYEMIDIFASQGWRRLDSLFRNLAKTYEHDTFALGQVAKSLEAQVRSRTIEKSDLDRLRKILTELERRELGEPNP